MTICNVGSRKLCNSNDYGSQDWGIFAPNLAIYGFDADEDACNIANANIEARKIDWHEEHFSVVLANTVGEATLYVTHSPMCSSLYRPNEPFLKRFDGMLELSGLDFTIDLETTTLDSFFQRKSLNSIDFLQVDVQGADLQVLEGATNLLDQGILAIQVEVEFSHLYVNQPLFADVDNFARKHGFTLFDLDVARWSRSPICSTSRPGQILWGDAFYLRDPFHENSSSVFKQPSAILKLACIADILGLTDYALELLEFLTLEYGSHDPLYNVANSLVESLRQIPELTQSDLESLPIMSNIKHLLT
ncbi:FkbM family methyltransferase [Leptolyngbya sp. Cla-17]|uniref:FkbM family methyltransferase n=1 Tax=Leptolyngbya sp. Cla-17 TaxID=2803751 RepID=UPI001F5D2EA7|nr:FkbM family methyltransferase [Leptolyngbya sp. Cla-17]